MDDILPEKVLILTNSVSGGGAEIAMRNLHQNLSGLGVASTLCAINEEFRLALKPAGLLTRDARMVERKKPGQKKARKRFQFSKR